MAEHSNGSYIKLYEVVEIINLVHVSVHWLAPLNTIKDRKFELLSDY